MPRQRTLNEREQEAIYKIAMGTIIETDEAKDYIAEQLREDIAQRCIETLNDGFFYNIREWQNNLRQNLMSIFPSHIPTRITEEIKNQITRKVQESPELRIFR